MDIKTPMRRAAHHLLYQAGMATRSAPPTFLDEAKEALRGALDVEEIASVIWKESRADEGTISATGARKVAEAVRNHLLTEA